MTITVFGATGMVGRQIVQQSLLKGYHVKAFGRNVYTTDFLQNENLHLIQGALFDTEEVYNAVKGSEAVISALGGGFDGTDKTRSLGMKNIILQMKRAGIKRIIGIGGMGVLNTNADTLLIDEEEYPPQYIPVGKEHQQAFELLKESGLDWTFVCPPDIQDSGPTGIYHTAADYLPVPNNYKINAGDLAMFILNELKKGEFIAHRVGISN